MLITYAWAADPNALISGASNAASQLEVAAACADSLFCDGGSTC